MGCDVTVAPCLTLTFFIVDCIRSLSLYSNFLEGSLPDSLTLLTALSYVGLCGLASTDMFALACCCQPPCTCARVFVCDGTVVGSGKQRD